MTTTAAITASRADTRAATRVATLAVDVVAVAPGVEVVAEEATEEDHAGKGDHSRLVTTLRN
jgi:hypothetical protein